MKPPPEPAPLESGGAGPSDSRILHVDMDAFYASVAVRDAPELRGRPVIVGGGNRGVVLSATYEARAFGVRSAMPMARARGLCPTAVVVPADHGRYREVSRAIMDVFRDVTPLVAPISLDEAFLDVGGGRRLFGTPVDIARAIRGRIATEQGLTCSVGVAPSMFVAKIASARCKPDSLLVVPPDEVLAFLHPLPTAALWGVGPRTEQALTRLGIRTIGDIARTPADTLRRALGAGAGGHLHALAHGRDDRRVEPDGVDVSVGAEETFSADLADPERLARELLRLSGRVAARLRARGQAARNISIKVRHADFSTVTRARTLAEPTDVTWVIYRTAGELFDELRATSRPLVRLLGVRAARLSAAGRTSHQLAFDERPSGWAEVDRATDGARRRFGEESVRPASLLPDRPPRPAPPREWGPGRV
ncbi:DNA polymerase IV [Parafrankia sp. FMc6]|uniref:DNA polymerase IV n=1 Tax=Parafrankia soli TaxID=2599596 RepID=UPI0034D65D9C